jgi:hypothetical protein
MSAEKPVRAPFRIAGAVLLTAVASCASLTALRRDRLELPNLPFAVDSSRTVDLAAGAAYHFVYSPTGPWAIHVLDVDRAQCWTPVAVKGGVTAGKAALGRERASSILREYAERQPVGRTVIGGVNADFFSLASGLPVSAHVSFSRVVAGPGGRPVFALDSGRTLRVVTLQTSGDATIEGERWPVATWNRPAPDGLAVYDENFGTATDTGTGRVEVRLSGSAPMAVDVIDTAVAGLTIPAKGHILVAGPNSPLPLRLRLASLKRGDTLRLTLALAPFHPMEAVGGFPELVRDSAVAPGIDAAGQPSFRGRNPRTAVGITRDGRRIFLVAVDGRQPPYSDGMTLRELATLMLSLGASEALNLDGGGSTTLVYADPDSSGALRVANRPSDRGGERTVGNVLAIVRECASAQPVAER